MFEKEAEEYAKENFSEEVRPTARNAYKDGAESREKRIAELEAQIEKMQNCRNCNKEKIEGACGHFTQVGWCKNWELAD